MRSSLTTGLKFNIKKLQLIFQDFPAGISPTPPQTAFHETKCRQPSPAKVGERDRPGRFQLASRRLARRLERPTSLFAAWRCRMSLAGGQRQRAGRPRSPERCQPGWRMFFLSMNPHLTLTLSPPIGWERRGNSRRTRIVPRRSVEQRQVHGPNARQNFGVEAFHDRR